ILVERLLIPFKCARFDDRVVVFAVVIPAKPQDDIRRGPWEFLLKKLVARYFSNIDCHTLCLRRWDLHKHQYNALVRSSRAFTITSMGLYRPVFHPVLSYHEACVEFFDSPWWWEAARLRHTLILPLRLR